jgi:hypothetical protein
MFDIPFTQQTRCLNARVLPDAGDPATCLVPPRPPCPVEFLVRLRASGRTSRLNEMKTIGKVKYDISGSTADVVDV